MGTSWLLNEKVKLEWVPMTFGHRSEKLFLMQLDFLGLV